MSVHAGTDANAGEAGEHDSITGIERVFGSAAGDRLVGDQHPNLLVGGRGNDTIYGGGTSLRGDRASGSKTRSRAAAARDRLYGGPRYDDLTGGSGIDVFACGARFDTVEDPQRREFVPSSCDELQFNWNDGGNEVLIDPQLARRRSGRVGLRMTCPLFFEGGAERCHGTASLSESRRRHRLLAEGSYQHGGDESSFMVPLFLNSEGFKWWTGALGRARAIVSVQMIAKNPPRRPLQWTIKPPAP